MKAGSIDSGRKSILRLLTGSSFFVQLFVTETMAAAAAATTTTTTVELTQQTDKTDKTAEEDWKTASRKPSSTKKPVIRQPEPAAAKKPHKRGSGRSRKDRKKSMDTYSEDDVLATFSAGEILGAPAVASRLTGDMHQPDAVYGPIRKHLRSLLVAGKLEWLSERDRYRLSDAAVPARPVPNLVAVVKPVPNPVAVVKPVPNPSTVTKSVPNPVQSVPNPAVKPASVLSKPASVLSKPASVPTKPTEPDTKRPSASSAAKPVAEGGGAKPAAAWSTMVGSKPSSAPATTAATAVDFQAQQLLQIQLQKERLKSVVKSKWNSPDDDETDASAADNNKSTTTTAPQKPASAQPSKASPPSQQQPTTTTTKTVPATANGSAPLLLRPSKPDNRSTTTSKTNTDAGTTTTTAASVQSKLVATPKSLVPPEPAYYTEPPNQQPFSIPTSNDDSSGVDFAQFDVDQIVGSPPPSSSASFGRPYNYGPYNGNGNGINGSPYARSAPMPYPNGGRPYGNNTGKPRPPPYASNRSGLSANARMFLPPPPSPMQHNHHSNGYGQPPPLSLHPMSADPQQQQQQPHQPLAQFGPAGLIIIDGVTSMTSRLVAPSGRLRMVFGYANMLSNEPSADEIRCVVPDDHPTAIVLIAKTIGGLAGLAKNAPIFLWSDDPLSTLLRSTNVHVLHPYQSAAAAAGMMMAGNNINMDEKMPADQSASTVSFGQAPMQQQQPSRPIAESTSKIVPTPSPSSSASAATPRPPRNQTYGPQSGTWRSSA